MRSHTRQTPACLRHPCARSPFSRAEFVPRVVSGDPGFDQVLILGSFLQQFVCVRFCHDLSVVIIDDVSLPPAGLKIIRKLLAGRTEDELGGLEGSLVVAGKGSGNALTGAGEGQLGELQGGIVRRRESAVGGETWYGGIIQVAGNESAQTGDFIRTGSVALEALTCQKLFQTHGHLPAQTTSSTAERW